MTRINVAALMAQLDGTTGGVDPRFAKYRNDPCGFAVDILGLRLWSHQRRALEAAAKHRRVSWRSAHGVGKSWAVMAIAAWWICTRPDSGVLITAPTSRQVQGVDFRTLRSIYRNSKLPLGGELYEAAAMGWKFPDGRFLIGFSAQDTESFAGFHAANMLVIVDEASGVTAGTYEAAKGALTGDSLLFLVGNPTQMSGEFYESHTNPSKAGLYHCLHTSAYDSPNVSGESDEIKGLVDSVMIKEQALDYGADSAAFAVRVLGEFPSQAADSVISLALVEQARDRWDKRLADVCVERLEIGLDPARFGDDASCFAVRRGPFVLAIIERRKMDSVTLCSELGRIVRQYQRTGERPVIRIDSGGLGGPILDFAKRQLTGCEVIGIGAGESAIDPRFQRRRDELWHTLRDWLRDGGTFEPSHQLEAELVAPRYSFSPTQKIVVESKDELRKRLRRSPDHADALALAVYTPKRARARYEALPNVGNSSRMNEPAGSRWR